VDLIGQTVSHYRILEKLGEGGMGEVYLAEDTSLKRKVALKLLPETHQQDPISHKRFIREAESAAALDHPFVCKIYEVGEHEGRNFIAMEYLQGQTLKERLAEGRIALDEALRIGTEIAEALEEAHERGIVHRDLKPANIMLTPKGHAQVLDFGLAKRIAEDGQEITTEVTREGTTLGTLAYMSPEQLRGEPVDTRSDTFALAVVLYEMLTGVHPFRKAESIQTITAILHEEPEDLSGYLDKVPESLSQMVRKMLAKDPAERFQSVSEVVAI
jgi:serine/threonine protein kinase